MEEPREEETVEETEDNNGKRLYRTLGDKIELCMKAERLVRAEQKLSWKAFCRENDVDPSQLRRWTKNLVNMKKAIDKTRKKATVKACCGGRPSRLEGICDKLVPWINTLRLDGKDVTIRMVAMRAKRFDKSLRRQKRYTLFAMVRRFCSSNGIVLRSTTHTSQEDPWKKKEEATCFLNSTRPLLLQSNRMQKYIINMDQTPYNPKDTAGKTLHKRGDKTVASKTMKTSVDRITCCLSVCADGTKLPPLLVYKGKPGGLIQKELNQKDSNYPKDIVYTVQENAWTDERVMLLWIDQVLRPHVKDVPSGVVPYLLLDKYRCHYQGSVAKAIEDLGVEWDIIPGGCTGLVQPIDVGIGKPFKNRMRYKWEEWMMNLYEDDDVSAPAERISTTNAREYIAKWASESWNSIPNDVVYNSWRHSPFSYFVDEPTRSTTFNTYEDYATDTEDEQDVNNQEVV